MASRRILVTLKLCALAAVVAATVFWPRPAETVGVEIQAITAGAGHTCALTAAGGLKCWGRNWAGEVGNVVGGSNPSTPVDVVGLGGGVATVAAGGVHTCALTTEGGVKCWGSNRGGELGHDRIELCFFEPCSTVPEDVTGLESGVAALAAGGSHTCAITTAGGLKCWGNGEYGQVGDGTAGDGDPLTRDNLRLAPVEVIGLESGVAAVAGGTFHTCALTTAGGVKCWGRNHRGQLGDGQACGTACPAPVDVVGLESGVAAIAAGTAHTCAVTTAGGVKCWGRGTNRSDQIGISTATVSTTPVDVCQVFDETAQECTELLSGVGSVAAGGGHSCALTTAGGVKCWGNNAAGQLGDGQVCSGDCLIPVDVLAAPGGPPLTGVAAIASGGDHTCALTTAGGMKCWGDNSNGQLGDGFTCRFTCPTPVDVVGLGPKPTPTATGTPTPTLTATPTAPAVNPTAVATPTAPISVTSPSTGAGGGSGSEGLVLWLIAAAAGAGIAAAGYGALGLRRVLYTVQSSETEQGEGTMR